MKTKRIEIGVRFIILIWGLVFLFPGGVSAGVYSIRSKTQWEKWTYPKGVVNISNQGEIDLAYFRKNIDAAGNAVQFLHQDYKGDTISGGIRDAGSNLKDGSQILDGDPDTWWMPDSEDELQDWWIEVDLGRLVAATKLRLIFPDTANAKPFENFTVYASPGVALNRAPDVFPYIIVGRTTKPNRDRVVEYPLRYAKHTKADTTVYGEYWEETVDFLPVHYLLIILDSKSEYPALAELQIDAVGDNIALGTLQRGGSWVPGGRGLQLAASVLDGDMSTFWSMKLLPEWEEKGVYFEWDLGALFWVDQIHVLGWPKGWEGIPVGFTRQAISGYILKASDGSRTAKGKIDYKQIVDVDNFKEPQKYIFKHTFSPRKVRYLFLRCAHAHGEAIWSETLAEITEVQIYGQGYPAGATMESDLIDLGKLARDNRLKNVTAMSWMADAPPDTEVEIRTCSGDSLVEEIHYYDRTGKEISKQKWEKLKRINMHGDKVTIYRPGTDWSHWSRPYRNPAGERFLSPSPKRYLKLQVKLLSDDPEATPSLSSVSIHYRNPLVTKLTGQIEPRVVKVDQDTLFTYLLRPTWSPGDPGFNQVLIKVPSVVESRDVRVEIDGEQVDPLSVTITGDSMFVKLPVIVKEQEVVISFRTRIIRNSTPFDAFVSDFNQPDIWQKVEPVKRGATTVSTPLLPASEDLITNLAVDPKMITPNGDGINDQAVIRFSVVKVEKIPKVAIYDLTGGKVKQLVGRKVYLQGQPSWEVLWDGTDDSGTVILPGLYICQIKVNAQSGNAVLSRTISIAH